MFVPPSLRFVAGVAVLQRGETLADLCRRFGRPVTDYPDLVAANLQRELDLSGPQGYCATLAGLHEGDQLYIPASWVGGARRSDVRGQGGTLRDEVSDSIEQLFPYAQNIPLPYYKAVVATIGAWWRQSHPGKAPTSQAELEPYGGPALQWMELIGKKLNLSTVEKLAWGSIPFGFVTALGKRGFQWYLVNPDAINELLAKNIPLGSVEHGPVVKDFTKSTFSAKTLQAAGLDQAKSWEVLARLRWDLLPDMDIDPAEYNGGNPQQWLANKITAYVVNGGFQQGSQDTQPSDLPPGVDIVSCGLGKVKIGGQCFGLVPPTASGCPDGSQGYGPLCIVNPCSGGQQMQIDPATGVSCIGGGGTTKPDGQGPTCPKGAEQVNKSCNCTPLGQRFVYDPIRNECVDCGPNASFNPNDGLCFCLPGYKQASDTPGTGCVEIKESKPIDKPATTTPASSNTTAKWIVGGGAFLALLAALLRLKK